MKEGGRDGGGGGDRGEIDEVIIEESAEPVVAVNAGIQVSYCYKELKEGGRDGGGGGRGRE